MCAYPFICFSQNVTLPDRIDKIELAFMMKNYEKVPECEVRKTALRKGKSKGFLKYLSKSQRFSGENIFVLCYEVRIFSRDKVELSFETDGYIFYDKRNNLLYRSDEDLLEKYWGITEENHCR